MSGSSNLLRYQERDDTRGLLVPDAAFPLESLQIGRVEGLQYISFIEQHARLVPTKSFLFLFVIWQGVFCKVRELDINMEQESLTAFSISMVRSSILLNVIIYA